MQNTDERPGHDVSAAREKNRRTVASYELCALDYARSVGSEPSAVSREAFSGLLDALTPGGSVLEVGSGPGWDADFLERSGISVRRTDAAQAFVDFQVQRGRPAERLDLISDDLGGPYDGVVALYVLQHVDRGLTAGVLSKIAAALKPGGAFLVAIKQGEGEVYERGSASGDYHVVLWTADAFQELLAAAGLRTHWVARTADEDGDWLTMLAKRRS